MSAIENAQAALTAAAARRMDAAAELGVGVANGAPQDWVDERIAAFQAADAEMAAATAAVTAAKAAEWTPPPTCRVKVRGDSGVMLHQTYYCGRRPAKGQDYCGQHLARMPYLRRRESNQD